MDQRTKLSYQLMIFLSLFFTCTSILMVIYFLGSQEDISDDSKAFIIGFYGISIFIFLFLAVYSFYGLKGKRISVIDSVLGRGILMVHGLGAVIHFFIPFFILMDIEDLGYYQRLMIMLFFISFWIIVLYFIFKITAVNKPKRKKR